MQPCVPVLSALLLDALLLMVHLQRMLVCCVALSSVNAGQLTTLIQGWSYETLFILCYKRGSPSTGNYCLTSWTTYVRTTWQGFYKLQLWFSQSYVVSGYVTEFSYCSLLHDDKVLLHHRFQRLLPSRG